MQVFGLKVPYVRYWLGLARTIIILRETEFTGFAHILKKTPPIFESGMGEKELEGSQVLFIRFECL